MNIRVVTEYDDEIGIGAALLRSTIGYGISSLFFFVGYLWMLVDDEQQTWHDKMVNTYVIYEGRYK